MALVVSSQLNKILNILVQNYIKLEPSAFKVRLLDFLIQNFRPLPPLVVLSILVRSERAEKSLPDCDSVCVQKEHGKDEG